MDTMLVRERYKVVRVSDVREDYAFAEAVDILDREKSGCLLNLYEGPLLRAYLPCFDKLTACPAFLGMFLEGETLVTVFRDCTGTPIDQVFYRWDKHDWKTRLEYAEQLFHQALSMADLPPEVSCATFLSENLLVDERNRELRLRYHVVPLEGMNARELVYLTCDQAHKILLSRFSSPREELEFLDELDRGTCLSVVQLYALWRERSETIRTAYEKLEKKNFFWRWCSLVWGRIRRRAARRKRR